MRYDMCRFLIGFSPRSKRRFVFRAFHIYIYIYISHFSSFISPLFGSNILSKRHRQPCQRAIHQIAVPIIDTIVELHLFRLGEYFIFISPANAYLILLELFTHPSSLLDPSVLGFVVTCRQCLVRQVINQSFATGRITRKYARLVIKTKRVQAKKEVRRPLPRPQQMRIWR